ncbi:Fanconi anemia group E protein isoform X2 [Pseudophryne corroboree]|uniref:Fanconi anemia group E protein isoform X2 n=1 Tax=Pseudophryne corroboree TaxID=495146 RepID=UPI003081897C
MKRGVRVSGDLSSRILMTGSPTCGYERASRLLLQALGTGSHGFLAAYKVLQNFPGPFPWMNVLEELCMKVPIVDGFTRELILKPRLALLPLQLQRNLFSILNFVFPLLPTPCIQLVAEAISVKDYFSDAWLLHLTQQFLRNCGIETPLLSPHVIERLHILCTDLNPVLAEHSKLDWYKEPVPKAVSEREAVQEDVASPKLSVCTKELSTTAQSLSPSPEAEMKEITATEEILPASIKAHISMLKQSLHLDMDSESPDRGFVLQLQTICDLCNPLQLQTVLTTVGVSQISSKCLFQLCVHLDAVSPDLSYAHAQSLASSLFLDRVLSLASPASRSLTAALAVFSNKYARPACNTLIGPVLVQAKTGSVYADFLCRMITECLVSHQLHLCFSPILEVPCSEVSISVLHLLTEKKDKFSPSEFDLLLNFLCDAADNFSKSVTFSKLLLVLLTSKHDLIQPNHIGPLTSALACNQTFMKKSLQSSLKKLQKNIK